MLKVGGASTTISGDGFFPGQTRLSGKLVQALRATLPDTDNVLFEQQADRLKIGDLSYKCLWEKPQVRAIQMPINAPLVQVLGIWQRYSDEEIEKSGFKTKFEAADSERKARIQKAFGYLSELGVSEEDLVRLVDEAIVRYNRKNYPEG